MAAAAAPITNDIILSRTGRELGPDFMLNVEKTPLTGTTITPESSITEVLNIVGYLCNKSRLDDTTINGEGSLDKMAYGKHNEYGIYKNNGIGAAEGTLYTTTGTTQGQVILFDMDTLVVNGPLLGTVIPQGILIRTRNPAPPGLHTIKQPVPIKDAAEITTLMSDCMKQMINILENTRTIFGPKGWTALFNKVKGGGGGAKRTHRQHRRKYSSKHY
jgi:hypothetical protein